MRALSFPRPSEIVYPRLNFADHANMRRQTEFNRTAFFEWVDSQPFNVENENLLVGLLQQLSINPEWTLEYVVSYTRLKARSLCTTFGVTNINRVGSAVENGFYRRNTREHWCLIENTRQYNLSSVKFKNLCPVVPLASTITTRGYSHTLTRDTKVSNPVTDLAVMGIDLVELAVGWWGYQRLDRKRSAGPAAYLSQIPLVNAQLMHNQLAPINILYEHFINETKLESLLSVDKVIFTTSNEDNYFNKYLKFLIDYFQNHRLQTFEHFLTTFLSLYDEDYTNYVRAGNNALFAQTMWIWEPALLKLYSLYIFFCNKNGYRVTDLTTLIIKTHREREQEYRRLPESYFKGWFSEMADTTLTLAMENVRQL